MPVAEAAPKTDVAAAGVALLVADIGSFVYQKADALLMPVFGLLAVGLTVKLANTKEYVYVAPPSEDDEEEVDPRFDGVTEFEEKEEPRYGGAFMKITKRPSSDEE